MRPSPRPFALILVVWYIRSGADSADNSIRNFRDTPVFRAFCPLRAVLQQQKPVSGLLLELFVAPQPRMLVSEPVGAILPPAGSVVALHHLDGALTGARVVVGPFAHLVGLAVAVGRPGYPVLGEAQVGGDAPLGLQPGALPVRVLVAMEVDTAVALGRPAAVGIVAAHVARAGVETEPSPVAQARRLESGGRRGGVGFLEGEGV